MPCTETSGELELGSYSSGRRCVAWGPDAFDNGETRSWRNQIGTAVDSPDGQCTRSAQAADGREQAVPAIVAEELLQIFEAYRCLCRHPFKDRSLECVGERHHGLHEDARPYGYAHSWPAVGGESYNEARRGNVLVDRVVTRGAP